MATRVSISFLLLAFFLFQGYRAETSTSDPAEGEGEPLKFHPRFARSAEDKSKEDSGECSPHHGPGPRPQKPPPECCKGLPRTCNPSEDPKAFETCMAKLSQKAPTTPEPTTEANGGKPPHGPKFHKPCLIECFYNETGLLTPEMKLQEAKITQKLTEKVKDTKFASMAPAAITKCLASAKAEVPPNGKCKSGAAEFAKCVNRELFMNCPTESWDNSEECQKMKDKLTKCPNLPVPMGPPPKPKSEK